MPLCAPRSYMIMDLPQRPLFRRHSETVRSPKAAPFTLHGALAAGSGSVGGTASSSVVASALTAALTFCLPKASLGVGVCPTLVWVAGACQRRALCGAQRSVCEQLPNSKDAAMGPSSHLILNESSYPDTGRQLPPEQGQGCSPWSRSPRRPPHRRRPVLPVPASPDGLAADGDSRLAGLANDKCQHEPGQSAR